MHNDICRDNSSISENHGTIFIGSFYLKYLFDESSVLSDHQCKFHIQKETAIFTSLS